MEERRESTEERAGDAPTLAEWSGEVRNIVYSSDRKSVYVVDRLLYVVQGPLMVGLVDETKNELYARTLQTGDMFVFPKGMVHFQFNGGEHMARAFSAFGSARPGTISLPVTLFVSGILDAVLEKSLHIDEATVHALEHDLAPPAPAPAPDSPPAPKNGAASLVPACFSLLVGFAAALLLP
ncbi:germin-like protein 9-1 [Triticum dicoccoides]|uniref:germin-like protein 9-1 n=1 Tax=Triticum dicoccoides TaxID=85692 RepID=UPI00188F8AB7|nr:germin-like protein 9-1 [Triticum dicoccoides]